MLSRIVLHTLLLVFFTSGTVVADVGNSSDNADREEQNAGSVCPEPLPVVVSRELYDELIGWIAIHTSYNLLFVYRDPVTVSFCDIGQLVEYEDRELLVEDPLRAAYDVSRRHIYIVRPWSPLNVYDRSILLHEMIHDVQLHSKEWECQRESELEAYLLQEKWLLEQGVRYDFDWEMILSLSRCEPEK